MLVVVVFPPLTFFVERTIITERHRSPGFPFQQTDHHLPVVIFGQILIGGRRPIHRLMEAGVTVEAREPAAYHLSDYAPA